MQFFTYALASLAEVEDHLADCQIRKVVDKERFDTGWDLAEHAKATMRNFMKPHEERCRHSRSRGTKIRQQPPPRT